MTAHVDSLSKAGSVLAVLLSEWGELPEPWSVELSKYCDADLGTAPVEMHMDSARDVAVWAKTFGLPVRVTDRGSFVKVVARFEYQGFDVDVWSHLPHSQAFRLLYKAGLDLSEDGVDVHPETFHAEES